MTCSERKWSCLDWGASLHKSDEKPVEWTDQEPMSVGPVSIEPTTEEL